MIEIFGNPTNSRKESLGGTTNHWKSQNWIIGFNVAALGIRKFVSLFF